MLKDFAPDPTAPLYHQLYAHLRAAILTGRLQKGTKLPSTRALADELAISRNTVLNAYHQLLAEGYLESIEGSGTYVAHTLPEQFFSPPLHTPTQPVIPKVHRVSHHAQTIMQAPQIAVAARRRGSRAFRPELPDLESFPHDLWAKLVTKHIRHLAPHQFAYQDVEGYRPLREAIADYVTVSRRVRCTPDQVIIVSGSQGGLDLAARVLLNPDDTTWIEDPGYIGARGALLSAGATIIPIPVDQEGLVVEIGIQRAPKARLVYLTPSHQFPFGMTMSLPRRLAILEWAQKSGAYLIEDDYNSEFRFTGRPLAALQGLDSAESVIYLGTFSKVLFPALRLGYLIVPTALVDAFLTIRRFSDYHPPLLEQLVLTEFITAGHFTRHLRRMRFLYAERRARLIEALRPLPLEISAPESGMHLIAWLPPHLDDRLVAQRAADHDISIVPLSTFSMEPMSRQGLMLGYAAVHERDIEIGVRALASALSG